MSTGKTTPPGYATNQIESGHRGNMLHMRFFQTERARAAHTHGANAWRDCPLHSGSLGRHGGTIRGVLLLTTLRECQRASVGTDRQGARWRATCWGTRRSNWTRLAVRRRERDGDYLVVPVVSRRSPADAGVSLRAGSGWLFPIEERVAHVLCGRVRCACAQQAGLHGDVGDVCARAQRIQRLRLVNQRVAPGLLELRACYFDYASQSGELAAWMSSQAVFRVRDTLSRVLDLAPECVHVHNAAARLVQRMCRWAKSWWRPGRLSPMPGPSSGLRSAARICRPMRRAAGSSMTLRPSSGTMAACRLSTFAPWPILAPL